jgi:hypothetical protein
MSKADEIAKISGFNSISAFVAALRHFASNPDLAVPRDFLDAANVIEQFAAEVERLSDKIDNLKEVTAWNVALSDAEVAALARGVNPASIRPDAIIDPGRIA